MMNDINKNRKEFKKSVIGCDNLMNKTVIMDLFYNGYIDTFISRLSNKRIDITCPTIFKKKYLTEYEQFIYVLDNFIHHLVILFNDIYVIDKLLPIFLKDSNSDILLSKKYYYYDGNDRKIFKKGFNKMIVNNFYNNCMILKKELRDIFSCLDIDFDKLDIDNEDDLNSLVMFTDDLCFVNRSRYGVVTLFYVIDESNYNLISMQYEFLLNNYIKNIAFVKDYRNFKIRNGLSV